MRKFKRKYLIVHHSLMWRKKREPSKKPRAADFSVLGGVYSALLFSIFFAFIRETHKKLVISIILKLKRKKGFSLRRQVKTFDCLVSVTRRMIWTLDGVRDSRIFHTISVRSSLSVYVSLSSSAVGTSSPHTCFLVCFIHIFSSKILCRLGIGYTGYTKIWSPPPQKKHNKK